MKIALVMLTGGSLSGGAAKHLRFVVPRMKADRRVGELRVFLPSGALRPLPRDWRVTEWPASPGRFGRPALKRALAEFAPDVIFVPTARWIGTPGAKTVVMVRNMEPFTPFVAGNGPIERLRNKALRHVALRACGRADSVIAVSQHVRDVVGALAPAALGKMRVVYHGIENPPQAKRPQTLEVLGDQPFVFTAGSIRPARGLTDVIDAWTGCAIDSLPHLVVAGATFPHMTGFRQRLVEQAAAAGVADKIVWAGSLSSAEMSWCFRNSRLFVMTSRAEACPNIVLEAMRHGCLSVSTDTPPMPEFFEDTAIYYRAGDAASLARSVERALVLPEAEGRRMRDAAFQRSCRFDWDRTAKETLEVLLDAADRG